MAKTKDPRVQTVNVVMAQALVEQLDAYLETLREHTPGASFTRSDVIRIAVEQLTRPAAAKPKKSAK